MKLKEAFFLFEFCQNFGGRNCRDGKDKIWPSSTVDFSIGVLDMPLLLFHLYNLTETRLPIFLKKTKTKSFLHNNLEISHIMLTPCGGLFIFITIKRFLEQKKIK